MTNTFSRLIIEIQLKLAIYIRTLHCFVRFIISDTALKFSVIIYYLLLLPYIGPGSSKNVIGPAEHEHGR